MRQSHIYLAIKEGKEEYGYPVELSCGMFGVSRAAYYRWLSGKKSNRELENEKIAELMEPPRKERFRKYKAGISAWSFCIGVLQRFISCITLISWDIVGV